jgi:hypothetical protein
MAVPRGWNIGQTASHLAGSRHEAVRARNGRKIVSPTELRLFFGV